MIQAPLQLQDYWVDHIEVRTNQAYDAKKSADLQLDSIEIQSDVRQLKAESPETCGTGWLVRLEIQQTIPEGRNVPYEFSLDITGVVAAHPSLQGDQLERAIEVNGPSMLFGAAREIIRAATGRGPFAPVIIPSTNFFQRLPTKKEKALQAPQTEPAEAPKKKAAKKVVRRKRD